MPPFPIDFLLQSIPTSRVTPIVGLLGLHHSYYLPANACSIASRTKFSRMLTVPSTHPILTLRYRLLHHKLPVVHRLCIPIVSPRPAPDRQTFVLTCTLAVHAPDVPRSLSHHVVSPTLYEYTHHTTWTPHRVPPSPSSEVSTLTALSQANSPSRDVDHPPASTLTRAGPPPRMRHPGRSIARPPPAASPPPVAVRMPFRFRLHLIQ